MKRARRRGGALLAVLWLTAALSAIVLTVALEARTEVERAGSALDAAQAYYLAEGSIERLLLQLRRPQGQGGPGGPPPDPQVFQRGQRRLRWEYASGTVDLEVSDEGGKLSLVSAPPAVLARLLVLLGVPGERAGVVAAGIVARREAAQNPLPGSSFSGPEASLQQLEEILTVPGMTPDIFYGWWERTPEGRLTERGAVARHLTMRPGLGINANYASPQVMLAVGVPDGVVAALAQQRELRPLEFGDLPGGGNLQLPSGALLGAGASQYLTVRATGVARRRAVRRTVAALVRPGRAGEPPLVAVRWRQTGD